MTGIHTLNEFMPPDSLRLGLGCSRLGSIGGASNNEARNLIQQALEVGVRFFDTSNIYGQGDSERLLGEVLKGRQDCVVATKAGKYVAWHRRALVPLKGVMRASARRSSSASQRVGVARAKPMPTRWDAPYLTRSLERSLKRLRLEQVQLFMLHSPPAETVRAGEAVAALDHARQVGKVGLVGVSVDDVETALACLADDRIGALQLPIRPGEAEFDEVVRLADRAGVAVIAREILGGVGSASRRADPTRFVSDRIGEVVRDPLIAVALVGATKAASLSAAVEAVRAAKSDES